MNKITNKQADIELGRSRTMLETITGRPVGRASLSVCVLSAYAVSEAQRHYDYACAVSSPQPANRWAIPRFYVGEDDGPARLGAKIALRRFREHAHRGQL